MWDPSQLGINVSIAVAISDEAAALGLAPRRRYPEIDVLIPGIEF
jgi:hypothetical protein